MDYSYHPLYSPLRGLRENTFQMYFFLLREGDTILRF